MFGTSEKFSHLATKPFTFPDTIDLSVCELRNEKEFIEFLLRNDWVQRIVGIKMATSNGLFPDIIGEIYDDSGEKIRVEIEYRAENYIMHRHPFRGCDLILSFLRNRRTRFIKGIPVWSFYISRSDNLECGITLYDDINTDFDKISDLSEDDYYSESHVIKGVCQRCGIPLYFKSTKICSFCKKLISRESKKITNHYTRIIPK